MLGTLTSIEGAFIGVDYVFHAAALKASSFM